MSATAWLRSLLAVEFLFYLLLILVLVGRLAWPWQPVLGLLLLLMVVGRAALMALIFFFSRLHAIPAPAGQRIGVLAGVALYFRELAAYTALFSLILPFERWFMRPDRITRRAADPGRPPLLLVHGFQCNRAYWLELRGRLERAGWQVGTISLAPVFADIDHYVAALAQRVDAVRAAAGTAQVILIGHSMGGLVARAYLRAHGTERVARLITLGSPHRGSWLARLGPGRNARQMVPGNDWLNALNAPGAVPLPAATVSLYSSQDNYVMPQDHARLDGAENRAVAGIGHLEMGFSEAFARQLLEVLEAG